MDFTNPTHGSKAMYNETNGTFDGVNIFCPSVAYGDCPYCDQCNICHIDDPIENCDDFSCQYEDWGDYFFDFRISQNDNDIMALNP